MITGSLRWYTVAARLRDAIYAALTVKPDRYGVVPATIAWDACDCGLLAVSITRSHFSEEFPEELTVRTSSADCDQPWEVAEVTIQIVRCTPVPDNLGNPPTTAALDASAQEIIRDAYETLYATQATLCQMRTDDEIVDYFLKDQEGQGPEGGCGGTELRVLVGFPGYPLQ